MAQEPVVFISSTSEDLRDYRAAAAGDPRLAKDNWVRIEGFEIARYPVTVQEYRAFVEDDGYQNEQWWGAGGFGQWSEPGNWEEEQKHPSRPVV